MSNFVICAHDNSAKLQQLESERMRDAHFGNARAKPSRRASRASQATGVGHENSKPLILSRHGFCPPGQGQEGGEDCP